MDTLETSWTAIDQVEEGDTEIGNKKKKYFFFSKFFDMVKIWKVFVIWLGDLSIN